MLQFLSRRWFMIAILIVIPSGVWGGYHASTGTVSEFPKSVVQLFSGIMTSLILFLMSVTLPSHRLWESFRRPGPVLWGSAINFLLIPLVALGMIGWQQTDDLKLGLMVAASVPCTLAAASVWTRKAGGNDAISLLITVLTNGTCFLITPLWLRYGLGDIVHLNTGELVSQLFITALLPILVGQGTRLWRRFREFADRTKAGFGTAAQVCILAIVCWAAFQSGMKWNAGAHEGEQGLHFGPVVLSWISCVVLHLAALGIALSGGVLLGFSREDAIGAAFASSQKTLPIGLFVAASISNAAPYAVLPILFYHASQLVLDSLFLERLNRWANDAAGDEQGPL